ncbi:MAG: amidohydrolase family protein [Solirubrobacteraceae bacterium]
MSDRVVTPATHVPGPREAIAWIDVQHHFFPPVYTAAQGDRVAALSPVSLGVLDWTPGQALAALDAADALAVLSIATPATLGLGRDEARLVARQTNEYAAALRADHPTRFGFLALLPMPDIDGTLQELGYALDVLGADGVGFLTSYGDRWIGDAAFGDVFAELDRRRAVAFVHPTAPPRCQGLMPGVPDPILEFGFDTVRAGTSLLLGGALDHYPHIRWILTHGGAGLPLIHERLAWMYRPPDGQPGTAPAEALRRLYLDTVTVANPIAYEPARRLVSPDHLLFASDYPYGDVAHAAASFADLELAPDELRAVARDNALRLFPRLAVL